VNKKQNELRPCKNKYINHSLFFSMKISWQGLVACCGTLVVLPGGRVKCKILNLNRLRWMNGVQLLTVGTK
jgi:hypothetical protein